MAHVIFAAVCLFWGSSFILMKWAGEAFGPISIGALRVAGGAGLLMLLWRVGRRSLRSGLRRSHLPPLAVLVVLNFMIPYSVQPHLIGKYDDSAFFGAMVSLVPLITIVISIPLLGVKPTGRQVVGVLGGLVCMLGLVDAGANKQITLLDIAIAIGVPALYALNNTLIKRWFSGVEPLPLTALGLSSAAILLLPMALAIEPWPLPMHERPIWQSALALAALGPLCTGLAIFLFYHLIQRKGPLYAGMVTYIIPLGALAWGWVDEESITPTQVFSLLGVLAMTALVQSTPRAATAGAAP